MAGWRDNYRPASFKGVPFEVLTDDTAVGRRNVVHEFPLRDEAEGEDLGRRPRSLKIQGAVMPGADYMARRDALIRAIEDDGTPGFLIHPYLGQHFVQAGPCNVSHHSAEGGWCRFSLEFTEVAQARTQPAQSIDTGFIALSAADNLQTQISGDLAKGIVLTAQPSHVVTSATAMIDQARAAITDAGARLTGFGDPLNVFVAQGLAIKADLLGLAEEPTALAARFTGMIQGLSQIAATPQAALGVLSPLMSFGADLIGISRTTPSRIRQADNQDAIVQFVQRSAAAEAVRAVASSTFASYEEAVAARDGLDEAMDALAIAAADALQDDTFAAIEAARQAMVRDVTARGGSLAHLYSYTPAAAVPALLLAHRFYADLDALEDHFGDLVSRNAIVHPGFVPGGQALEVLSDG